MTHDPAIENTVSLRYHGIKYKFKTIYLYHGIDDSQSPLGQ